jgi:hypothetical protein
MQIKVALFCFATVLAVFTSAAPTDVEDDLLPAPVERVDKAIGIPMDVMSSLKKRKEFADGIV